MRGVGDAAPYRHNPQSFSLPQMGTAARGLAALQPHLKICVGRGASTPPKPAAKSLSRFTRRGGIHPSRVVRPYCCTTQKAGANISFAPAVLLLRSHSLITLFVIFRTAFASSWESSYLYANFDCPFKTLTNCSLDLPSGSLFAQKHLWNGVMFVIKIVLGVMGLMPRTKAS